MDNDKYFDIINSNNDTITLQQLERVAELKNKQLPNVHITKRLRTCDIHKIVENTLISIFDPIQCVIWIQPTNTHIKKKSIYINFYFKDKKKIALHRLIYINFKEAISDNEYIRYNCANKGICCNINHMFKCEYASSEQEQNKIPNTDIVDNFKVIIN